jgi:uncharacterized protein (TIGR03435 family)
MRRATLLLLSGSLVLAQIPPARPAFEVVSIKPTRETMMSVIQSGKVPMRIDDAQVMLRAVDLQNLLTLAYRLPQDQISGPAWLADERFEINAKLPAGSSKSQVPEILQAMLAERFKMTIHHEEKVRPVYLLVSGKGPLKLEESVGGDPRNDGCQGGRGGHHTCQNVNMEQLAELLSRLRETSAVMPVGDTLVWLDRPVVDKTGLKGAYDFTMDYGRVGATGGRRGAAGDRGGDAPPTDGGVTVVPIADAVKALGLALRPGRQPFDILVIDHIERVPTEN